MNKTSKLISELANKIYQAEVTGITCDPLRDFFPKDDLDTAYAIQQVNIDRAIKLGRRPVGRKIGLTSKVVQAQLGVDQPDYGYIFADMVVPDGEEIPLNAVLQPKVEAEVALILEKDLTMEHSTIADLIAATAYVLPAIEVVGSRLENWDIKITDTIADNASSGLVVLGNTPKKLTDIDLRMCGMVMESKGQAVSIGAGAACLGSPLNAAVWLAAKMVQLAQPLKAGDIIMTGALGPMVSVTEPSCFEARISGLGSVRANFGDVR